MNDWRVFGIASLFACALLTALMAVYSKHYSRKLYIELQALQGIRDDKNVDWGRLQLEQSTWATHTRIEEVARERLHMVSPTADATIIVPP
jgi:cell division protein FtsL